MRVRLSCTRLLPRRVRHGEIMYRRLILPVMFLTLAYGFWVSPTFKDIAAGVAGVLCMEEVSAPSRAALWKACCAQVRTRPGRA